MAWPRIRCSGGKTASSAPGFLLSRAWTGRANPAAVTRPEAVPARKSARRDVALFMTPLLSRYRKTSGQTVGSPAAGSAADFPVDFLGETFKEIEVVGAFRGLAHPLVDPFGIGADQDAPAVGLDAVEDDF